MLRLARCIRSGQSANVENEAFEVLITDICKFIDVLFQCTV